MDTVDEFARALVRKLKHEASGWVGVVDRTPDEAITDPYFRSVSRLCHSLDDDQKLTFLAFVQQVKTDGVASAFAAIEGVSYMEGWVGDFRLTYEGTDLTDGMLESFLCAQDDEADLVSRHTH